MKNIDKIHQMTANELAKFLQETFDPDEECFGCYSCTNYETHHYPKDCGDCYWLNIGGSIPKWLEKEVEE